MPLETMRADPAWDAAAHSETVDVLAGLADAVTIRVWGGDWCKDCRALLPGFAAALAAAGIAPRTVEQYPVEKAADGTKVGPGVEAFGIEYIPTIVVEREGEEIARFVESEPQPPAVYLANRLAEPERAP